jgi:hypothetical protein
MTQKAFPLVGKVLNEREADEGYFVAFPSRGKANERICRPFGRQKKIYL